MDEENQPKDFMELLKQLVLVEQKIVTASFLCRHTPLDIFQTQRLMKQFLESDSNIIANYYLLGPLKAELGKKQCAIVRGEHLTKAKRLLAKIDICNIFSVQEKHTDGTLEDVFKAEWLDWKVRPFTKEFRKESEGPAQPKDISHTISQSLLLKDKEEVNEEDDREADKNAETKKATGKLFRRPILFTPISKEEEQKGKQQVGVLKCSPKKDGDHRQSAKGCAVNGAGNSATHPPVKRPMAQPIKREAKVAKTKATENGGGKQTSLFTFFKK